MSGAKAAVSPSKSEPASLPTKSEQRAAARVEWLSKGLQQTEAALPASNTSTARKVRQRSQSARPSGSARGGPPRYMQQKKKAGERWRPLLKDEPEIVQEVAASGLTGREWTELLSKLDAERGRTVARASERKAAAEAAVHPKPTSIPKPANWRKKTFATDALGSTQAHAIFEGRAPTLYKPPDTPPSKAATYGSARPMSVKGRQYQLEKQRQMQEMRRLAEMRAACASTALHRQAPRSRLPLSSFACMPAAVSHGSHSVNLHPNPTPTLPRQTRSLSPPLTTSTVSGRSTTSARPQLCCRWPRSHTRWALGPPPSLQPPP